MAGKIRGVECDVAAGAERLSGWIGTPMRSSLTDAARGVASDVEQRHETIYA